MENHFSLIRIEAKLRSLLAFSGSSGILLKWRGSIFVHPKDLHALPENADRVGGDVDLEKLSKSGKQVKTIALQSGYVVFVEPSPTLNDQTLQFLGDQLEEEISLATMFDTICKANMAISSKLNLNPLLNKVMGFAEEILDVEVTAVLLFDPQREQLYWEVSRGPGRKFFERKLTIPLGLGIAGHVARTGEPMMVQDVLNEPKWAPEYDRISGFQTRSLLCVPVKFHGNILGVIEVINKRGGLFTLRDMRLLETLAAQTGGAIENAGIYEKLETAYEDVKALDKAKERIINHLSHELRTPLSIIGGVLGRMSRELKKDNISTLDTTIERGQRNVSRLLDLQVKIDDILNRRLFPDTERMAQLVENTISLLDELGEQDLEEGKALVVRKIKERLESVYKFEEAGTEKIVLNRFLDDLFHEAASAMGARDLEMIRDFEAGIILETDSVALKKVCGGLLRNAIENTPDEGKIEVKARAEDGHAVITFRDYGVGISEQNQKMIFGGFFHTLDTEYYSSKKPYQFNAGGSGSDLLRTKVFSERLGFTVDFESTRCHFIPGDTDLCSGKISTCPFVEERPECLDSGGSTFTVKFPIH
jgi:signal transduction histidine kinase